MKTIDLLALVTLASATLASRAHAHLGFTGDIKSRDDDAFGEAQKMTPCDGKRGDGPIYTFEPGSTIKLSLVEAIPHPGYYRIAFDADGENFKDPRSIDPVDKSRPCPFNEKDQCGTSDYCNSPEVLLDRLNEHTVTSGPVTWNIKLPDVECDKCVLQIIQVMEDTVHGAYCPSDSCKDDSLEDIYHRCVDIKLVKGAKNSRGVTTEAPTNQENLCPLPQTPASVDPGTGTGSSTDAGASKPDASVVASSGDAAVSSGDPSGEAVIKTDAGTKPTGSSNNGGGSASADAGKESNADGEALQGSSSSDSGCALARTSEGAAWTLLGLGLMLARRRRRSA